MHACTQCCLFSVDFSRIKILQFCMRERVRGGGEWTSMLVCLYFSACLKKYTGTFFHTKRISMANFSRFWATWKITTKSAPVASLQGPFNYWDYICYTVSVKHVIIAKLLQSLNCWVENHLICMIMPCVGFEVYTFSRPSSFPPPPPPPPSSPLPPFRCLQIFGAPLNIFNHPPLHLSY